MTYQVPAASRTQGKKAKPFEFTIAGKTYGIPPFVELVTPQELLELAELPLAQQNGVALQRFAKALPAEAKKQFKSHGQITGLFQAWQQHGGASVGESGASAD